MSDCLNCGEELTGLQRKWCSSSCKTMGSRKLAKMEGRCRDCRTKEAEPGHVRCASCHEKHMKVDKKYRKKLKREGRCTRCGSTKHTSCNYYQEMGYLPER